MVRRFSYEPIKIRSLLNFNCFVPGNGCSLPWVFLNMERLKELTFLCSAGNTSHIDATIFETSPNEALGFCPLIAACVSRKKRAYAETGL